MLMGSREWLLLTVIGSTELPESASIVIPRTEKITNMTKGNIFFFIGSITFFKHGIYSCILTLDSFNYEYYDILNLRLNSWAG